MNRDVITFCIERLREIAADDELRDQFDLQFWGNKLEVHPHDQPEDVDCGFAGCFLGWAAHQQWFAPFGLRLVLSVGPHGATFVARHDIALQVEREGSEPRFHQFVETSEGPGSRGNKGIWAAAYAMGIDSKTLSLIIYEEHYDDEQASAADVADRLTTLLALGERDFCDAIRQRDWDRAEAEDA